MKILVVDDNIDFADGMAEMLALLGHQVHAAYSCGESIAAAGKQPFELALIDVGLADRNGAECAHALKIIDDSVACVLMTGHSMDALARMGVQAADFDILRKPVKPENLAPYLKD